MYRISPNHLLWALEELVAGRVHNRIVVPPEEKRLALDALNRMLAAV
jgi:quinolinate synthase